MRYSNITRGTFLDRPNRFIAHVELDGHRETVHVKNTGRCRELLLPGAEVWLTAPGTEGRKTKYDLVTVRKENGLLINCTHGTVLRLLPAITLTEDLVNLGCAVMMPQQAEQTMIANVFFITLFSLFTYSLFITFISG